MICDHVTILAVSDWLNQAVTAYLNFPLLTGWPKER